jgi:anionic cell wall polymer biosynthesis LytR-Cps2A-Psr (LCP) family protein
MTVKILLAIMALEALAVAVLIILLKSSRKKAAKAVEEERKEEQKKNEAKENLSTGNNMRDVTNGLDLLQNNGKH